MRKAEKRRIGREKQEKNLRESREAGLQAQHLDSVRRDNQYKQNLIDREAATKKIGKLTPGTSKKALEKATRAADRLAEKALEACLIKAIYTGGDFMSRTEYVSIDLRQEGLGSIDTETSGFGEDAKIVGVYTKKDVAATVGAFEDLYEITRCEKYSCQFSSVEEHLQICPGNVSFRDVPYVKGYTHEEMDQQAEAESIDLARINAIYGTGI